MDHMIRGVVKVVGVVAGTILLLASAMAVYVLVAWDRPVARTVAALKAPTDSTRVRRGQYLYEQSLLCWDCHGSEGSRSPSEPQAGGRWFDMTNVGPGFGSVYSTNVTPDQATGIGAWSDGERVRAIREGVSRD